MDLFDILTLIGGLSLFLFGMDQMGSALERRAGEGLKNLLGRLTSGKAVGFLTGLAVTAVIQSSSATTVMVVGFVNSGLMSLRQAINVIMGANVGTTVTAWIFSLTGIESGNLFVQLLKPTSFTPVLALIGVICMMSGKSGKRKDTGMILLGFAVLMFGMDTMSGAVAGLRDVPQFRQILLMFTNPILGVVAGALLTAIIQSSSASVGILQALASTGQVTYGAAIPIIMGQNIGTCVTAMLSSVGTNRNARRAAVVHLSFNIIGTALLLLVFQLIKTLVAIPLLDSGIDQLGIAVVHSVFNVSCTALLLPATGLLEKLFADVSEGMPWAQIVDITQTLTITDYYRTDTHWRQEMLFDAANALCSGMGVTGPNAQDYTKVPVKRPFYGVYYGQAALPMDPDTLYVLKNDILDGCSTYLAVQDPKTGAVSYEKLYNGVYDLDREDAKDMYEMFLSGSESLLRIENPNAKTDKELVVFRDSFGSSMVPLLVNDYKAVTLVDIRYISSGMLGRFIDFTGKDVLFL